MRKRRRGSIALTLLCAMALLAAPGALAGTAFAAPEPQTGKSLEQVRKEIEGLYREAGTATDAFNLAESEARTQSEKIVLIANMVQTGQDRITVLKSRAGAAARAQYRSGGLPPGAQLALSDDPTQFLDGNDRLRQGEKATSDLLSELNRTQTDLQQYAQDASAHWETLEANRVKQEAAKKQVEDKIKAAEELESKLEAEQKARLLELEAEAQRQAQRDWLSTGAMTGNPGAAATDAGGRAVQYAVAQIGKPYVWGAEGPGSFDCSGLTSQAWLAAGRTIPRTSQEQLRLPKIAVKDMRPGDLIIYFDDASHVGMYVGDGAMVHAPRPGRNVTMAGAGSMPIKAVVRPDA